MESAVKFVRKETEPFHAPGTLIFAADGILMRDCPHCGRGEVPSRYVMELEQHVGKRLE